MKSRVTLFVIASLLAAACSSRGAATQTPSQASSGQPTAASSSLTPSTGPTAAPSKGPATAQFSLAGSNGLTGPMASRTIICGQPSLGGSQIEVLGQAGSSGPDIVLFVVAGHIEARVATGSGPSLLLRSFVGTGVTAFDAAVGAQLDSTLTESTEPGAAIGKLGALSRISGTLDCGDQQPGTANLTVSGNASQGTMTGALTGYHVMCTITTSSGTFVGVTGLGVAGSTPVLVFVTASDGVIRVAVETRDAAAAYVGNGAGIVTLVPGGAQMSGDVTESVKAGNTPHTLHVEGSATCGTTVHQ